MRLGNGVVGSVVGGVNGGRVIAGISISPSL